MTSAGHAWLPDPAQPARITDTAITDTAITDNGREESAMYIGLGTVVLIVIIVLVVMLLRRV